MVETSCYSRIFTRSSSALPAAIDVAAASAFPRRPTCVPLHCSGHTVEMETMTEDPDVWKKPCAYLLQRASVGLRCQAPCHGLCWLIPAYDRPPRLGGRRTRDVRPTFLPSPVPPSESV